MLCKRDQRQVADQIAPAEIEFLKQWRFGGERAYCMLIDQCAVCKAKRPKANNVTSNGINHSGTKQVAPKQIYMLQRSSKFRKDGSNPVFCGGAAPLHPKCYQACADAACQRVKPNVRHLCLQHTAYSTGTRATTDHKQH